jgi:hypothetical protein
VRVLRADDRQVTVQTLRRTILWLAVAILAMAVGGLLWVFAVLPKGVFTVFALWAMVTAFLFGCMTLAGYAFVYLRQDRSRKSQNSLFFFIFGALTSALLVFIGVHATRALPPQATPGEVSVLILIALATISSIAWASLMLAQMIRDEGWREPPPTV